MKKKLLILIPALILFLFSSQSLQACPYCNYQLFTELFTSRSGSLASEELLNTIRNQNDPNSRSDENLAALFNPESNLTPGTDEPKGEQKEFIEIINRDNGLPIPPTGYVPQNTVPNKEVTIELYEGEVYIGEGVMYKGFVTNGTIPGPTIVLDEGDIVKFTVVNKGKYPHGASIHAAYVGTSKYLGKIEPGETKSMIFKVVRPGVYLYHCAPGGHAIPMHIIFGQYGMIVVKPKKKYKLEEILHKPPDVEIYLNQQEFYSSGKDAIDGKPMYVTFNGKLFRYVENPIRAKPGDYVRIYFLNSGPNLISTFHIVGIIWDYAYWQGNPDVVFPGGQTVTAGPSDSWVIEFRMPPDAGNYYTMLTHAVGSTDRGAMGLLICDDSAKTPLVISGDGPKYSAEEMANIKSKVTRIISPFEPSSPDVDPPQVYGPEIKEVTVQIIGNSFYPKVIQISEGTTVKWINEDIFTYQQGEFGGIHNVASYEGAETFSSNLLTHTQSFSHTFDKEGEVKYMCTPHPYMKGVVIVKNTGSYSAGTSKLTIGFMFTILGLVIVTLVFNVWDRKTRR